MAFLARTYRAHMAWFIGQLHSGILVAVI